MKVVSIVTQCYNEQENVKDVYEQVKDVLESLAGYGYEHIFIDNASTDATVSILKDIAKNDRRVKVIVNARNFGQTRSGYHALLQTTGDAVVGIVADLQDPPSLIRDFVAKWEEGYKVVMGIKEHSEESRVMFAVRTLYYRILRKLSAVELVEHWTGFGLYDRQVVELLRSMNDPYPYVRGMIAEMGFPSVGITYVQRKRKRGKTKNSFYDLFDLAMLGMTSHTRVPLRIATILGFATAGISLLAAVVYLVLKLAFWSSFSMGLAPLIVGLFFFSSVQLIFLGIVGEYVGSIHTYVQRRPLVIERERINFD